MKTTCHQQVLVRPSAFTQRRFILVCREERARKVDGIDILPWQDFLEQLWSGNLLGGA
ncbi:hypothetical protein [Rectinema subterraneum]|uniref:hypothetical protein n=1 Tax=Rectinema subterraneum TaxID=2653714 RepID=UPI00131E2B99|nr:hypothetical protein [Rectinema subterraneum]